MSDGSDCFLETLVTMEVIPVRTQGILGLL